MAAHLNSGRLNLGILRESYRRELLECLNKCSGNKAVVWDDTLTGPFGLIAEYSLLKEHEVDKMFPLKPGPLPTSNVQNIIFIVRPRLALMSVVANVVKSSTKGYQKDFHIFFVPKKTLLCEKKLEDLGVRGNFVHVEDMGLDIIPVDTDVLSMESDDAFKECMLQGDNTSLFHAAKALMTIQALFGIIPNIHGKGQLAKQVCDIMLRMRRELAGSEAQITPQIDNLLLLDRMVDPLTPLLTQLTYEGLIDEIYGINNTNVKLPPEKFSSSSGGTGSGPVEVVTEPKKIVLNNGEEMYSELRDKNFNAVGKTLSKKAKMITQQFGERHQAKTVGEIKEFVSKLPHMQVAKQSLATHTSIAELVKEVTSTENFMDSLRTQQEFINGSETDKPHPYIEDCIARQEDISKVLRLMCIQCYCNNGFKIKLLDYYKREIIQTYGYEHILTLVNLEKIGLFRVQTNRLYPVIKKTLKLLVEDVNEQHPGDIAYVFSGYAPLSVRLAQFLARPGWRSITEILNNYLPGPTFEEVQPIPVGLRKRKSSISSSISSVGDRKVTLVFFIGGVTYAEIAALKFLSGDEDGNTDYIVATTKIINGRTWLSSIHHTLEPKAANPF